MNPNAGTGVYQTPERLVFNMGQISRKPASYFEYLSRNLDLIRCLPHIGRAAMSGAGIIGLGPAITAAITMQLRRNEVHLAAFELATSVPEPTRPGSYTSADCDHRSGGSRLLSALHIKPYQGHRLFR